MIYKSAEYSKHSETRNQKSEFKNQKSSIHNSEIIIQKSEIINPSRLFFLFFVGLIKKIVIGIFLNV